MGNYYSPFPLRVPEELIEKIKHIADINKRSANKEMEYILQLYTDAWEKDNGAITVNLD